MDPIVIGSIVFAFCFGGALAGMALQRLLPQHHLDAASKDTVKVGIGLVATMTALVLGLVTASAKNAFDVVDSTVKQTAVDVLTLDHTLGRYGAETREIRLAVKRALGERIDAIWPEGSLRPRDLALASGNRNAQLEALAQDIVLLAPSDDVQRVLRGRAQELSEKLIDARWMVLAGTESTLPKPFLVVLLFWLTITFASFGLFAPRNATVLLALLVSALSVGSAMFLVLEMDSPFSGLMRVSAEPLQFAHERLGR